MPEEAYLSTLVYIKNYFVFYKCSLNYGQDGKAEL